MAKKLVKKALDEYFRANHGIQNKSDAAELIGIKKTDIYSFFKGDRILDVMIIKKIADFFAVNVQDAILENADYIEAYKEERGLK